MVILKWPVIVWELAHFFDEISKDNVEREKALRIQLAEVTRKMETIEEKLYLNEMPRAIYDK